MEQTAKYKLPQWEAGDLIRREDFNDFAAKAEEALAGFAENHRYAIHLLSYRGSGGNTQRIELGYSPAAAYIAGMNRSWMFWFGGYTTPVVMSGGNNTLTWPEQFFSVTRGSTYLEITRNYPGSDTNAPPSFSDTSLPYFAIVLEAVT